MKSPSRSPRKASHGSISSPSTTKTVATSLAYKVGSTKYLYNSGYLPERSWLAVGLLNHAINILSSIEEGIEVYDFMRGDERYKYHLGAVDRHIFTARLDKKP